MKRSALLAFDNTCRLELSRTWEPRLPCAAWLMLNPSTADGEVDDQTVLRVIHFSRKLGCGSANIVNILPWRATDPADMLHALRVGHIKNDMLAANLAQISGASFYSQKHVVAFGVTHRDLGWHRERALEQFAKHAEEPLLCLGTSPGGWPLHPLARGKFAIRNETEPMPWVAP